jgi:hypothetical protein
MIKSFTILLCSALMAFPSMAIGQTKVYVSPTGNDAIGNGSERSPYYSLAKAIEGGTSSGKDTLFVEIAAGDYFMTSPLTISRTSRPVVFRSISKEKPRIMGGRKISGWKAVSGGLYRAYLPEVKAGKLRFEQLFVNGRRAILARTPNTGFFKVSSSSETVSGNGNNETAQQKFNFNAKDWSSLRSLKAKDLKQMRFRFYHKWDVTTRPVQSINTRSASISTSGKKMKSWNPITQGSRYVMYDYLGALDAPGEWYLDNATGYVYYKPRQGEDMSTAECIVPTLTQWVVVTGTATQPVKVLRFENLSFQYTAYLMPDGGEEPVQAAASAQAAMRFDFVRNVSISNCELLHTGSYALWFNRECHYNTISHCYIADLGAGGIKVGENFLRTDGRAVSSHNVIDNNIITSSGHELPCGVGIAILNASDNQVTHNEISDLLYSGISVGWTWGYNKATAEEAKKNPSLLTKRSPAINNTISYNHVHHIGWGELSDMGAVYTLGESPGTKVTNNWIHDVWAYDYGGWGLYTDEGSTGVEMSSNLVERCKSGGFHQNYGKENIIQNNIFAYSWQQQLQLSRAEDHVSMHFKHNIIVYDHGDLMAGQWQKAKVDMDYNLYWRTDGNAITVFGQPFATYRSQHERHSINADPLFRNALQGDYSLTKPSVERKISFQNFDSSQAGVYGEASWKQKAKLSAERIAAFKEIYGHEE